jgi:hypothetical protein
MWAVVNRTPYSAERSWGRDKDGVHEWIVAVKGTFDIKPDGALALAEEQLPPLLMPEYNGEAGTSSLRYDADLMAPKPTTDIVLNATAYAPENRPSTEFAVSVRVGPVHKVIRVLGNRIWKQGPFGTTPSSADPVTQIPIVYERAFGGFDGRDPDPKNQLLDTRNPVGYGVAAKSHHRVGQPVPNFEYPHGKPEKDGPAGFGPIDSFWSPRRELNGTYDSAWEKSRSPLLPLDWNPRSLLCSPVDQLPGSPLHGGEMVELLNLTPGGLLRFQLPKVYLTFRTRFGSRTEEHRSRLATVIVEPDHPRVIMVWSTSLLCPTDVDYLDQTIVDEKSFV